MNEQYKAKADEIYKLIKSQPQQVIGYLADFYGKDDDEPMCEGCIEDVITSAIDNGDFNENPVQKKYIIKTGMCLPDIEIDIHVFTDAEKEIRQDDEDYIWRYSAESKGQNP